MRGGGEEGEEEGGKVGIERLNRTSRFPIGAAANRRWGGGPGRVGAEDCKSAKLEHIKAGTVQKRLTGRLLDRGEKKVEEEGGM